jgi:hypothetical protein
LQGTQHNQKGFFIALAAVITLQIFQACRAMQEIETLGKAFPIHLERSNWVDADIKLKRLMLMFLTNLSNGQIKLNLYRVRDVNLETFLSVSFLPILIFFSPLIAGFFPQIINTAFSAYAMLNSLH